MLLIGNFGHIAGASLSEDDFRGSFQTRNHASNEFSSVQPEIKTSDEITRYEISNEHDTNNRNGAMARTTSVVDGSSAQVGYRATGTAQRTSYSAFTPRQISTSISASENIRLLCSLVIALLVILAHHGLPLFALGSIISFRPLLLVLLTDATLILGPLLLTQGNDRRGHEAASSKGKEGDGWATNLGGMLEVAMLLQKALGAVFMDCSICAVIMICGTVA